MINSKILTEKDIGRWVEYKSVFDPICEIGRIKSWEGNLIFVVYKCNNDWENFMNYTGCGTHCASLKFIEPPKEQVKILP